MARGPGRQYAALLGQQVASPLPQQAGLPTLPSPALHSPRLLSRELYLVDHRASAVEAGLGRNLRKLVLQPRRGHLVDGHHVVRAGNCWHQVFGVGDRAAHVEQSLEVAARAG